MRQPPKVYLKLPFLQLNLFIHSSFIYLVAQRDAEFQGSSSSIKREADDPEVSNQPGSSNNTEEGEDHNFGDYISR